MLSKRVASVGLLSLAVSFSVQGYAADQDDQNQVADNRPVDVTASLPNAKPGECFAKVIIPAQFELRPEEVVVIPESEAMEVIPATFDTDEKEIEFKPEYTELKITPTTYRTEFEEVEIEPARTEWYTHLRRNGIPASPALIVAAKTGGIDIDEAPSNTCYKEYYEPAKFEKEDKQVLIKEGYEEYRITKAQFENDEEEVEIKPSYTVKKVIPPIYETEELKIEIEPAKAVWKKGAGLVERIDNTTGEIMCLIQIPAKYNTISKKILKEPGRTVDEVVQAETKNYTVQKLVSDASHEKIKIEPVYSTVTVRKKVEDPKFVWLPATQNGHGTPTGNQICLKSIEAKTQKIRKQVVEAESILEEKKVLAEAKLIKVKKLVSEVEIKREIIPAKTTKIEKRVRVSRERLEWRRVLCRTNMTTDMNKRIQASLKREGFYAGPIDGSIGRGSMNAIEAYQRKNGLPRGGLTIQVLESLGLM